ncbi:hypothetical protein BASA81_007426 [Batrachochytrium salamandrivorans]|nr:hypothetical protein BASA81_007426 [Batrachochytrium salamandrivorans]
MDPTAGLSSKQGRVGLATEQEGLLLRNTMHFRVKSDVFLPAGGRPAAINAHNWKQFLDAEGKPSSPIIVEGANLFLTAPARKHLSLEAGCMIVKDSSANKCGVITSSYEVLGGMILSPEQFLLVKEEYVAKVLERLRYLAKLEADMLMREWRSGRAKVLPETCIALSHAMLRLADKMDEFQQKRAVDPDLLRFVASLLPMQPLMRGLGFATPSNEGEILQVLEEKLPPAYLRGLISKVVASECVYREGMTYFSEASKAVEYIKAVHTVDKLAGALQTKQEPLAAQLLRAAGARALVENGSKFTIN